MMLGALKKLFVNSDIVDQHAERLEREQVRLLRAIDLAASTDTKRLIRASEDSAASIRG